MFEQLIQIFSGDHPLKAASEHFTEMLNLARNMVGQASGSYWGKHLSRDELAALYDTDIQVNKLQRKVRKRVIVHLAGQHSADVPYGLLLMSLVKDAERLGDYAKNLVEVHSTSGVTAADLPKGDLTERLREIADFVEELSNDAPKIYLASDQHRAQELTSRGRVISKQCDDLQNAIARSDVRADVAVDLCLAARFYKRIAGHLLNLLSSVLMPLHKLDYVGDELRS